MATRRNKDSSVDRAISILRRAGKPLTLKGIERRYIREYGVQYFKGVNNLARSDRLGGFDRSGDVYYWMSGGHFGLNSERGRARWHPRQCFGGDVVEKSTYEIMPGRSMSKPMAPVYSEGKELPEAGINILKYKGFVRPERGRGYHAYRIWHICCEWEEDTDQLAIRTRVRLGTKGCVKCRKSVKKKKLSVGLTDENALMRLAIFGK